MRLWSVHPRYLDSKGLVALWREGLLARHVLEGRTKGYARHPQLERFKRQEDPVASLDAYLAAVLEEAAARGYAFDGTKIAPRGGASMPVTAGQMAYEREWLAGKLAARDPSRLALLREEPFLAHPSFLVIEGPVEDWERI